MAVERPRLLYALHPADLGQTPNLQYVIRLEVFAGAVSQGAEDLLFPPAPMTENRDYWMAGDGVADGEGTGNQNGVGDLLSLLEDTLEEYSAQVCDFSVTFDATVQRIDVDLVTGTGGANTFILHWDHANTTLLKSIWGFLGDTTPKADEHVAAHRPRGVWWPDKGFAHDSRNQTTILGGISGSASGLHRASQVGEDLVDRVIGFRKLPPGRARAEYAETARPYDTAEDFWLNGLGRGRDIRVYDDHTSLVFSTYRLDEESPDRPLNRDRAWSYRWEFDPLELIEVTP